MMNRIGATFSKLKNEGRCALVPFVTAGFPELSITPKLMHAMVDAGADIIELGIPFSDPSADGPIIQKAGERALQNGVNLEMVLDMVREFRMLDQVTPVVLMGYANPIEAYGLKHGRAGFAAGAAQAGVDGVLVVDYPPNECVDFSRELKAKGIDLIFLLAPTSSEARMQMMKEMASGYVYYVSLKGVTGSGLLDTAAVKGKVELIKKHISIPVGVGFGIRDAQSAKEIGKCADAVIIGSRLIQLIEHCTGDEICYEAGLFLRDIREALDQIRRKDSQ